MLLELIGDTAQLVLIVASLYRAARVASAARRLPLARRRLAILWCWCRDHAVR
jgi:hypothetical protein